MAPINRILVSVGVWGDDETPQPPSPHDKSVLGLQMQQPTPQRCWSWCSWACLGDDYLLDGDETQEPTLKRQCQAVVSPFLAKKTCHTPRIPMAEI